jgi:site-specific DNA recombinase
MLPKAGYLDHGTIASGKRPAVPLWRLAILTRFRQMHRLEARKAELERRVAHAEEPLPLIHSEMASFYRQQVAGAAPGVNLSPGEGEDRTEAAERLHSLVSKIVPMAEDGRLAIAVHGDLAGIPAIAHGKASSAWADGAFQQAELVAGIGFEPMTFRL